MKYLLQQKTSNPDFFISGKEEKLNNILCSCLCCVGQLLYFQNRNWNISTESWPIIVCTLIVLLFGRVGMNSCEFIFIHQTSKNRVWGICFCICTCIFVIICIRICEPPVAWDFWEQGWRWDGGGRVIARPPKQLTTMTSSIGKAALQPLYFKPCICCGSTLYLTYIHTSVHLILLYCFTLYEFSTFF